MLLVFLYGKNLTPTYRQEACAFGVRAVISHLAAGTFARRTWRCLAVSSNFIELVLILFSFPFELVWLAVLQLLYFPHLEVRGVLVGPLNLT